jgi:agmatine deiminase
MIPARRRLLQALGAAALPWPSARAANVSPMPPGTGLAADFDPASAVWLGHAPGHEALARGLAAALQAHVKLHFLVADDGAAKQVRAWSMPHAQVTIESQAEFFLRDVAVFTREPDGKAGIVDFQSSQYGAALWCRRRHAEAADAQACTAHARERAAQRDGLDRKMATRLGAVVHSTTLALEGGGVEVNGRGLMIANEDLHRSRNPGLSRAEVERELLRLPGLRKLIWLPAGLAEDALLRATIVGDHVAWGAGGHTDEFVRFADERTVLLAWPDEADAAAHPVARLSRARMQRCHAVLAAATDTLGRHLRVVKVPMPRIVQRRVVLQERIETGASDEWVVDYFPPSERRRAGQALWQVATASYLNFVVANGVVVLPDFVPHGTPVAQQERVRRVFANVFAGRRIEFVDGITAHWVGGGLHCATLNQPA